MSPFAGLIFQIFTFIGSSVICLSLSEIPIWTHQREFGLKSEDIPRSLFQMDILKGLKVVGNEKKGGFKIFTVVGHKSGTVAIDVHFHFERAMCH